MANEKSFTQMQWKELSTKDVIGPVKAFHQVTGAGNMANAAQVPTCLSPEQTGDPSVDEDYLYVFWISGVELRCEPVGEVYSKDLTQKWIQSVKYGKKLSLDSCRAMYAADLGRARGRQC